ncbi:hypothetical protein [Hydrogenophaga pseudoflava]|uniref:hypothetical protein n=1 Tax=Hydrogenophaga pseudoflava TaxID=47421 RepID=UPI0027E5396F|nr:hypothetical protein [Hydrogenophaga pseudoflava]MDQ7746571.1 hypothetical protein [Hydrogenophaga pseudoflava]
MNTSAPHDRDTGHDEALREQLKHTLAQGTDEGSDALQARVLAQWRQARPPAVMATWHGPLASLQAGWRLHPVLWTGALVALAMALWMLRPSQDPALEELMQPDVLTLISAGEL